jgi:dCTP deaminase
MEENDKHLIGILNEREIIQKIITGELIITPLFNPKRQIGPASIDIRLGCEFEVFNTTKYAHLDPLIDKNDLKEQVLDYTNKVHIHPMEPFILHPGEFVLASTLEYFSLSYNLVGRLEGRSTWGRLGLQVHSTAGFVDPGFEGILTFELQNMGKGPISLFPGIRIAQICFYEVNTTAIPYTKKPGAKYFRRLGTSGSYFFQDPEFDIIRKYCQEHKD